MANPQTDVSTPAPAPERRGLVFGLLAVIAALSAGWALFLWRELVASRSGGQPVCAFGQEGCAALWDAGFASAIHGATGMPVAGWGLVWSLVAFLLPLFALIRAADGRVSARVESAIGVTAAAGALGVVVMLAASAAAKLFCSSCAVTYVLTLAYAVVAFARLGSATSPSRDGFLTAGALTAVAYFALLYPGLRTPENVARSGEAALAATAAGRPQGAAPRSGGPGAQQPAPAVPQDADRLLAELVANLAPAAQQALSDSLHIYRESAQQPLQEPRALRGPAAAPVRITEFSDVLCGHCAELHRTIDYIETILPAGSYSVDSRNFPLDGNCNRYLGGRGPETERCIAARARVCVDRTGHGWEYTGALLREQPDLTPAEVRALAAPYLPAAELERCLTSPETAQALAADVDYAWQYRPDGTPLVLVNGRQGTAFGPFLYAMVLTGGDPDHPAFAALPPANPNAHIH